MPMGVISCITAVFAGGLLGAKIGKYLDVDVQDKLNMMLGLCAVCMGIKSIDLMENMPVLILSAILGTLIGHMLHLGEWITKGSIAMQKLVARENPLSDESMALLLTTIVIFCASGTGIYGAIVEGITHDSSILVSKAILDFFTALIFACTLGYVVSLIAIPVSAILVSLYLLAGVIMPLTTPVMINDFKACGGFFMIAAGFRVLKVKMFPTTDMIPAMILAMPLSWFWVSFVAPLL